MAQKCRLNQRSGGLIGSRKKKEKKYEWQGCEEKEFSYNAHPVPVKNFHRYPERE